MHNSLKIIKTLLYSYSALHVSGTLAPINCPPEDKHRVAPNMQMIQINLS
jgi:hypothetical protein